MAKYRLEISRTAERQLKKLPRDDQKRVVKAILQLADEPFPKGCRKLSGYEDVFRVRVGHYRVLYSAGGKKLILIVVKAGDRKGVYW
jgi:mRNA interferase RelE/StbE